MAGQWIKKLSLFFSGLMTMQALRLVISASSFFVVRFNIDPSLLGIFISRLVNAADMFWQFGVWTGVVLIAIANALPNVTMKVGVLATSNWLFLLALCCALGFFCHSEDGHLTAFYWSLAAANFMWKVSEQGSVSIMGPESCNWYFATFTLSAIYTAVLKGFLLWVFGYEGGEKPAAEAAKASAKTLENALGGAKPAPNELINKLELAGQRSVKTSVEYKVAFRMFTVTIVLTLAMCVLWTIILERGTVVDVLTSVVPGEPADEKAAAGLFWSDPRSTPDRAELHLENETTLVKTGSAFLVKERGGWKDATGTKVRWQAYVVCAILGILPGLGIAALGAGLGWILGEVFKLCMNEAAAAKAARWAAIARYAVGLVGGVVVGAVAANRWLSGMIGDSTLTKLDNGTLASGNFTTEPNLQAALAAANDKAEGYGLVSEKTWVQGENGSEWNVKPLDRTTELSALIGLGLGAFLGALAGMCIGACKGPNLSGLVVGAFVGAALGILTGLGYKAKRSLSGTENWWAVAAALLINVFGLGTVFAVYPGMAPSSITEFKYFDRIDIWILVFSALAPFAIILICELTRNGPDKGWKDGNEAWGGFAALCLVGQLICMVITICVLQYPTSKLAQDVTSSPVRAGVLTVTMVAFQLASTGIGFPGTMANSNFNESIMALNYVTTLLMIKFTAGLGEGYLTELKKYKGHWPTRGMGRWRSYSWWNARAFGNAWQIWSCICTTDLRRDIMLCKK